MKKFILPLVLLFVMACSVPGFAPSATMPLATMPEGALETAIVQTADAAQTQTAAVLPTSTFTPLPTRTPFDTPTPTVTFIYKLYTDTPLPSETPTIFFTVESGQAGGDEEEENGKKKRPVFTGREWTCSQVGVIPPKNTEFKLEARFVVYWTLMNTGTKTWTINGVDFVYSGGYRHEETKIQDFTRNVSTGQTITVSASFQAPKKPGVYQTFFNLMVGKRVFCAVKYIFEVIE